LQHLLRAPDNSTELQEEKTYISLVILLVICCQIGYRE
jgi:hypothetical protein